jgi:hypothetical protein
MKYIYIVISYSTIANLVPFYSIACEPGTVHNNTAEIDVSTGFFNKKKLDIQLRIPTKEAYGFEGKITNKEQEEKVNEVTNNIIVNLSEIIQLPKELNCKLTVNNIGKFDNNSEKYDVHKKGEHKSVKTDFPILKVDATAYCDKDTRKQLFIIDLSSSFKTVNKIFVSVDGSHQRKFTINNSNGKFNI